MASKNVKLRKEIHQKRYSIAEIYVPIRNAAPRQDWCGQP